MSNKIITKIQIGFIKRIIWKRHGNKLPETEANTALLDQLCLRFKMDARDFNGSDHDKALATAKEYLQRRATWYDVDSFAWKSRDNVKLLRSKQLGELISLTEWEWYQWKPSRGDGGIVPIDKGTDIYVAALRENKRRDAAREVALRRKSERSEIRKLLESDVARLLADGLSYRQIADIFQKQRRYRQQSGPTMWEMRDVFAFDPDRKDPERKRRYEQELLPEKHAAQVDKVLRIIRAMHSQGDGYGTIAKALNQRGVPSRKGCKWTRTMVKRELVKASSGCTQEVYSNPAFSPSTYTSKGNSTVERASGKVVPAASDWNGPALMPMPYTQALQRLYVETSAELMAA
jgi:hypothetical protein